MAERDERLVAWFGDDMSGSIDVMEALHDAGLRGVLLLGEPDPADAAAFPEAQAIGWAGDTRGRHADDIRVRVARATRAMAATGARILHHKICSTFDSSPDVGSIGATVEAAQDATGARIVPVLAAAPRLHRWTCFGNLFARSGWSSPVYRLDRHPTMREHPVTPMREADLRLVLAEQTPRPAGLVDLVTLRRGPGATARALDELEAAGTRIAVCDALDDGDLHVLGEALWERARGDAPLLVVGSAGVEHALAAHWARIGMASGAAAAPVPGPAEPVLALSGSRSPVTRRQVARAVAAGWSELALDAALLLDRRRGPAASERWADELASRLEQGTSAVAHTLSGELAALDVDDRRRLGEALGTLGRAVLARVPVRRLAVVGGDSSGHVLRAMGAVALEAAAPFAPAMPLCRAHGDAPVEGLEVICKGGQVGGDDLFEEIRAGRPSAPESEEVAA